MRPIRSQNWGFAKHLFFFGVLLTITSAAGIWLGSRINQVHQSENELTLLEGLSSEIALIMDSVQKDLTKIQIRSQKLAKILLESTSESHPGNLSSRDAIRHLGVIQIEKNQKENQYIIKKTIKNPGWKLPSLSYENAYLSSILEKINLRKLEKERVQSIEFKYDPHQSRNWIAIIQPLTKSSLQYVVITLVDPLKTFSIFKRYVYLQSNQKKRLYITSESGNVLAHSQISYVGSDITETEIFKDGVLDLFQNEKQKKTGRFVNVEGIPVWGALKKVDRFPFGMVLEDRTEYYQAENNTGGNGLWTRFLGESIFILGILVLLGGASAWYFSIRSHSKINHENPIYSESRQPFIKPVLSPPQSTSKQNTEVNPPSLDSLEIQKLMSQFELNNQRALNFEDRIPLLAEISSKICSSPILFFSFSEGARTAILSADAGFPSGQAPASLVFSISLEDQKRIKDLAARNQMITLSQYEPLANLLLETMGTACFEAWALANESKFYGILVILHANSESTQNRGPIFQLIQSAVYFPKRPQPSVSPTARFNHEQTQNLS